MAKPDPALLKPSRYPYSCVIDPRFGDLDVNLHINNVAIAGYLEDGRVRFHRASRYREGLQVGLASMVASLTIEYLGEGHYPDPVRIYSAVETVGRTSHGIIQLITQGERIIAFSRSVMVAMGKEGPEPIPPVFLENIEAWKLLP